MFDRILVPLDGTEIATTSLVAGDRLAQRWGSELEALALLRGVDAAIGLDDTIRHQTEGVLDDDHLIIRKLQYSVADDIAQHFDAVPNTLIVMNTDAHARSAALSKNVAEQVMRGIRQPLLLLGQDADVGDRWPAGPMMVCTDGSDFAESVGTVAASWAQSLGLPLMLVTVIDSAKVPAGVSVAGETNSLAHFADSLKISLKELAAETSGPDSSIEIDYDALHGADPDDAIIDYAEHFRPSMIVMATHGRSGLQRALYGSVTMSVVHRAPCPVLVLRP